MATCQYHYNQDDKCRQIISGFSQVKLCEKHMAEVPPVPIAFEPVNFIWEDDFSRLVTQVYGKPYRFQQQETLPQDSIWKFEVEPPEELTDEVEGWVDEMLKDWLEAVPPAGVTEDFAVRLWWHRDNYPPLDAVLIDLRRRGLIEPGKYALHIWW